MIEASYKVYGQPSMRGEGITRIVDVLDPNYEFDISLSDFIENIQEVCSPHADIAYEVGFYFDAISNSGGCWLNFDYSPDVISDEQVQALHDALDKYVKIDFVDVV